MKIHYTWDQQEDFWNTRYAQLAKELGISMDLLTTSRAVLISAFGLEWLKSDYESRNKSGDAGMHVMLRPSITKMITNPIVNSAISIVEMTKYLDCFKNQSAINDVITMLKSKDQFEPTRLSIAMAYRLSRIGFDGLVLEPTTTRGKGDILGSFQGQNFLFECSIVEDSDLPKIFSDNLTSRLDKAIKDKVLNVGIEVNFLKKVEQKDIDQTIETIRKARYAFGQQNPSKLLDVPFSSSVAEGRIFRLSEEELSGVPDMKKWDFSQALSYATPAEEGNIYTIDLDDKTKSPRVGMIFVKGLEPVKEQKSFYDRLKDKIESKRVQTHGLPEDHKRIFVIMTEQRVESFNWSEIWKKLEPSMKSRPNIAGVIFVSRGQSVLDKKIRYVYPQIHYPNPYHRSPELENTFLPLKKFERSDWLAEQ